MNRAKITCIVPVSDQILLLVFKDTQTGEHNVKFLLHQIPNINLGLTRRGSKIFCMRMST